MAGPAHKGLSVVKHERPNLFAPCGSWVCPGCPAVVCVWGHVAVWGGLWSSDPSPRWQESSSPVPAAASRPSPPAGDTRTGTNGACSLFPDGQHHVSSWACQTIPTTFGTCGIFFPLVKDGRVHLMLKEIKERSPFLCIYTIQASLITQTHSIRSTGAFSQKPYSTATKDCWTAKREWSADCVPQLDLDPDSPPRAVVWCPQQPGCRAPRAVCRSLCPSLGTMSQTVVNPSEGTSLHRGPTALLFLGHLPRASRPY